MSAVERLLQKSQRQRRVGQQQRFPGEEQQHHTPRDGQPGNGGPRRLHITMERRAGSMAGSLTGLLRTHGSADVTFATIVSIFKCLRVLSLTNLFLSQHRASCVFSFAYEKPEQHQERVQRLIEYQHSPPKRGVVPSEQQQQEQQQQQASTAGGGQEPVPRLPSSVFRLHTWSRNLPEEGLQQPWGGRSGHVAAAAAAQQQQQGEAGPREQVLDFSLDLRQPWRQQAYVSFDTAMSIADELYAQLMGQLSAAPAGGQAAAGGGSGGSAAGQQQEGRPAAAVVPSVTCCTDMTQGVLLFASLSFVQQRLLRERVPRVLVVEVLWTQQGGRAGPVARLDGRASTRLRLELQPLDQVQKVLRRQRTFRRQQQHHHQQPL